MADIVTITADQANAILGQSVVSGSINSSGHLILTRDNGQTIDAGDFTDIVTGILAQQAATAVAAALPGAVAGKFTDKGNVSGAITFTAYDKDSLPNATIVSVLTGDVTIDVANLPTNPRPGTQFAFRMKQDATGGHTLTLTGFKKSQGVLTLTGTANSIDILVFYYDGTNWYAGMMGDDFK